VDGRVLGENGDAALTLERVRVHHALGDNLILTEGTSLPEHLVDECRFAMIDVCDDGDIPNLHSLGIYRPARSPNKLSTTDTAAVAASRTETSGIFHLTVRPDECTMHS
jgi:hypothetical protein